MEQSGWDSEVSCRQRSLRGAQDSAVAERRKKKKEMCRKGRFKTLKYITLNLVLVNVTIHSILLWLAYVRGGYE